MVSTPEQPPPARVERPSAFGPPESWSPPPADFQPREGDVLVVSYPEVTLPLPRPYASARVGGYTYTRRLRDGDDVALEALRVYRWLARFAEESGADAYKRWTREFGRER